MQGAPRCGDVKTERVELEPRRVPFDEDHVLRRVAPRRGEQLGDEIDADDLAHEWGGGEGERAGAGAGGERAFVAAERDKRRQLVANAVDLRSAVRRELLCRRAEPGANVVGVRHPVDSRRTSSSASSRVEITPAARSSAISSRSRPISGPGGSPSSSPRTSGRSAGSASAASSSRSKRASPAYASAARDHGSVVRRKRWIAREDGSVSGRARRSAFAYRPSSREIGYRRRFSPKT